MFLLELFTSSASSIVCIWLGVLLLTDGADEGANTSDEIDVVANTLDGADIGGNTFDGPFLLIDLLSSIIARKPRHQCDDRSILVTLSYNKKLDLDLELDQITLLAATF